MAALKETLIREVSAYARNGYNSVSYFTSDDSRQVYVVSSIANVRGKRVVNTVLIARLVEDKIVIEQDINDKILMDALIQAGVPRKQIILAYIGETLPEKESA